ncbi:MAG: DUF5678 domain-containing protein [bacterium]|nr:DUF5678 domain-containing protein [bacterium]
MKHVKVPIIDVKKYGGKQVAIVNGKIIASGHTLAEVVALARKQVPKKPLNEISIFLVPPTLSVIYYV